MSRFTDRIAEARDIAVEREGDIRLKEFLRAMIIEGDPNTSAPPTVTIFCEFKSWMRYFTPDAIVQLESLSADQLADTVASWVQGAFANGMLSISNPPTMYWKYGAHPTGSTDCRI